MLNDPQINQIHTYSFSIIELPLLSRIFLLKNRTGPVYSEYSFNIMSMETESLQTVALWNSRDGLCMIQDDIWKFRKFRNKTFDILTLPVIYHLTYFSPFILCLLYGIQYIIVGTHMNLSSIWPYYLLLLARRSLLDCWHIENNNSLMTTGVSTQFLIIYW